MRAPRAALFLLLVACGGRAVTDDQTGSTTGGPDLPPAVDVVDERCAWIVECEFGWTDEAECRLDHEDALRWYLDEDGGPACEAAVLGLWSCANGNGPLGCSAFWASWGLLEHNEGCAEARDVVCGECDRACPVLMP